MMELAMEKEVGCISKIEAVSTLTDTGERNNDPFTVLYFSRGRGRGHAIPDMAIARELRALSPDALIRFCSYSSGAAMFRDNGFEVIDLKMPDQPDIWDALFKYLRLIDHIRPDLVVAHEEPQAIFAADVHNVPSVFVTDFFYDPSSFWMQPLRSVQEVIFIGEAGLYTQPPFLSGRISYVGPAVRPIRQDDNLRRRTRMALLNECTNPEALLLCCQSGNHSEALLPLAKTLLQAWVRLPLADKRLVWISATDHDYIAKLAAEITDVTILDRCSDMAELLLASDVVLTKGNRITTMEAASIGVPTITVTNGTNWPDDVCLSQLKSNIHIPEQRLTVSRLTEAILQAFRQGRTPESEWPRFTGVAGAANRLCSLIKEITLKRPLHVADHRHLVTPSQVAATSKQVKTCAELRS